MWVQFYTMKSLRHFSFFFVCLFATATAFAWGPDGHRIVGEIAMKNMNKTAQDSFAKYMGDTTVAQCASWLDQVRKMPEYANTANWHYINMEKGEEYHANKDTNSVTMLYAVLHDLQYREKLSKAQIAFDLKVLVHLVGDLHMPLHNGYGSDRGGNNITVKQYMGQDTTRFGKPFNLHGIWDGDIIYTQKISTDKCLAKGAVYTDAEKKKMLAVDFVKWMQEGRAFLPTIYTFDKAGIDQAYVDAATPTVEDQIYRAGIRLGYLLDMIFAQ